MIEEIEFAADYKIQFFKDALNKITNNDILWHNINQNNLLKRLDFIEDIDVNRFVHTCKSLNEEICQYIIPENVIKIYMEDKQEKYITNYMIGEKINWCKQSDVMSANYYKEKVMLTITYCKNNNGFIGIYDVGKMKWINTLEFPDVCGIVYSESLNIYIIGVFKDNIFGLKECSIILLHDEHNYEVIDIFKETWERQERNKYVHEYSIKLIENLDGCIIDQDYDGVYLDELNKACYIKKEGYFFMYKLK